MEQKIKNSGIFGVHAPIDVEADLRTLRGGNTTLKFLDDSPFCKPVEFPVEKLHEDVGKVAAKVYNVGPLGGKKSDKAKRKQQRKARKLNRK